MRRWPGCTWTLSEYGGPNSPGSRPATSGCRWRVPTSPMPTATEPTMGPSASADRGGESGSDIADPGLAEAGRARIGWARRSMPVLGLIGERFAAEQSLGGLTIAACLHVTTEAAVVVADGAAVVYARAGADRVTYDEHIHRALDSGPDLVVDDGGDLVNTLHTQRPELLGAVLGGCESTTTGVIRLRRMASEGTLAFPAVAADTTATRLMFDNRYGTGQSALDGIVRATNVLLAGKAVVVAGY